MLRLPDVSEVAVFGVPDERLGEVPVAVIHSKNSLSEAAFAPSSTRLAKFKIPARFVFSRSRYRGSARARSTAGPEGAARELKLDRRTLLIGGGAGVGLIVGFALWPRRLGGDLSIERGEQAFGNYIKIGRDGRITVAIPQTETGQGIWTALPQIVADELGAAWDTIAVEPAPLTTSYANRLAEDEGWPGIFASPPGRHRYGLTNSPFREAAATARAMLIGAAADRWNLDRRRMRHGRGHGDLRPTNLHVRRAGRRSGIA